MAVRSQASDPHDVARLQRFHLGMDRGIDPSDLEPPGNRAALAIDREQEAVQWGLLNIYDRPFGREEDVRPVWSPARPEGFARNRERTDGTTLVAYYRLGDVRYTAVKGLE